MGNCCGKRRFPLSASVRDRCSSQSSSSNKDENSVNNNLDRNNNRINDNRSGVSGSRNSISSANRKKKNNNSNVDNTNVSITSKNSFRENKKRNSTHSLARSVVSNNKRNSTTHTKNSITSSSKNNNFDKDEPTRKSKNSLKHQQNSKVNYTFSDDNHKQKIETKRKNSLQSSNSSSEGSINLSLQFIQHIRDREEPEVIDINLHPFDLSTPSTFFLKKALEDKRKLTANANKNDKGNNSIAAIAKSSRYKNYSSCSTIIMDDSTLSRPNQKAMVKCVALALYYHIRHRRTDKTGKNFYNLFDEKLHPLSKDKVPDDYYKREPDHKAIYRFLRQLFTSAQLNAECAIVMLVYLERIMSYGDLRIDPSNWKRLLLGSVLLASKVWDDQAVWNVDYCQILHDLSIEDMNALERHYLDLLQFNINIGSSVYAKYYFDLRHLAVHAGLIFNTHLLTKKRATKLDASNRLHLQKNREHRASHILPKSQQDKTKYVGNSLTDKKQKITPNLNGDGKSCAAKILLHRSHSCNEHLEKKTSTYVFS